MRCGQEAPWSPGVIGAMKGSGVLDSCNPEVGLSDESGHAG